MALALDGLDPASTLVVVVSKTFTTQETIANALVARAWLRATTTDEQLHDGAARTGVPVRAAPLRADDVGVSLHHRTTGERSS